MTVSQLKVELESLHKLKFYQSALIDDKNEPISMQEVRQLL